MVNGLNFPSVLLTPQNNEIPTLPQHRELHCLPSFSDQKELPRYFHAIILNRATAFKSVVISLCRRESLSVSIFLIL
jgi:hypothetical protein